MRIMIFILMVISFCGLKGQEKLEEDIISVHDKSFVEEATKSGLAEVEMGKLAQKQGNSQFVKTFGFQMENDHSKANREVKEIAGRKNISLSNTLPNQQMMDQMSAKSGTDFDKAFMAQMVIEHEKAISLFENFIQNGRNTELINWAKTKLPVLKAHLKEAKEIEKYIQVK